MSVPPAASWVFPVAWALVVLWFNRRPVAVDRAQARSAATAPEVVDRAGRRARSPASWMKSYALAMEQPRLRSGGVMLAAVMALTQQLALAALIVLVLAAPPLLARRRQARIQVEIGRRLPELVDVVRLGAVSGLPLRETVTLAATVLSGPVATVLGHAVDELGRGHRLSDVMTTVGGRLGPDGRSVVAVVMAAELDGTDVGVALADLSTDLRRARAARAEARARRLPVLMLFPLVSCVLPAFALLSVVPVVVAGISEALRSA